MIPVSAAVRWASDPSPKTLPPTVPIVWQEPTETPDRRSLIGRTGYVSSDNAAVMAEESYRVLIAHALTNSLLSRKNACPTCHC